MVLSGSGGVEVRYVALEKWSFKVAGEVGLRGCCLGEGYLCCSFKEVVLDLDC